MKKALVILFVILSNYLISSDIKKDLTQFDQILNNNVDFKHLSIITIPPSFYLNKSYSNELLQKIELTYNNKLNSSEDSARYFLLLGFIHRKLTIDDLAYKYYSKSLVISEKHNLVDEYFSSKFSLLGLDYKQKSYIEFHTEINEIQAYIDTNTDTDAYSLLLNFKGNYYLENRDDKMAIETFRKSLSLLSVKNYRNKLGAYNGLGLSLLKIDLLKEALYYFEKGLSLSIEKEDFIYSSIFHHNISLVYMNSNAYKKALVELKIAAAILEKISDHSQLSLLKIRIGQLHLLQNETDTAAIFYKEAVDLANKYNDSRTNYMIYSMYAGYLLQNNNASEALSYLLKADSLVKLFDDNYFQTEIYDELATTYSKLGQYREAYKYSQKSIVLKDSTNQAELRQSSAYTMYKSEAERIEKENILISNRLAEQKTKNHIYTFTSLISLLLLVTFFIFRYKRLKNKAKLINSEKIRAIYEKQDANNRIKQLKLDVAHKTKLIHELEQKLHGEDLSARLIKNLSKDGNWSKFIIDFELIYPGFIDKLKKDYPLLTKNDLRFVSLYKLNLSDKEISKLLHITPDSTRTLKYRLKSKLYDNKIEDVIS